MRRRAANFWHAKFLYQDLIVAIRLVESSRLEHRTFQLNEGSGRLPRV